jgi:hypothetical protein
MLQLPNPERGEKKALRAGQGANGRQFSLNDLSAAVLPGAAALRLGFASTSRGFTDREVTGIIHGDGKSSFQAMVFPLVRGSVLHHFARSCRLIGNWVA